MMVSHHAPLFCSILTCRTGYESEPVYHVYIINSFSLLNNQPYLIVKLRSYTGCFRARGSDSEVLYMSETATNIFL